MQTLNLYLKIWLLAVLIGIGANTYERRGFPPVVEAKDQEIQKIESPSPIPSPDDPNASKRQSLQRFFQQNDCRFSELTDLFISTADKNNLDWRLLPAIYLKESSCGKYYVYNNPLGFGIKDDYSLTPEKYRFDSVPEAIEYVGAALAGNNGERAYKGLNQDTKKILWKYNGTVNSNYPSQIISIMDGI